MAEFFGVTMELQSNAISRAVLTILHRIRLNARRRTLVLIWTNGACASCFCLAGLSVALWAGTCSERASPVSVLITFSLFGIRGIPTVFVTKMLARMIRMDTNVHKDRKEWCLCPEKPRVAFEDVIW
ncbi:hypothetical protein PAXRUDRAFT_821326 [Paxillus rubicundulus Ve08.2h10]|uniref:Uncharacterized protein n=1 Tax=Paxillus rubicundulus Ve08.2h10 TaxID=930991 RepID=A0A0D0DYC5_9AGAM|nr:hypothetical protein PAXRUDRAFT_821326 [Paxillus rubicundulus Ve08.2h10]